jgi:hypothetical protein
VNTSNVVLKTRVMPEWRKLFEAKDSDFGAIQIAVFWDRGKPYGRPFIFRTE